MKNIIFTFWKQILTILTLRYVLSFQEDKHFDSRSWLSKCLSYWNDLIKVIPLIAFYGLCKLMIQWNNMASGMQDIIPSQLSLRLRWLCSKSCKNQDFCGIRFFLKQNLLEKKTREKSSRLSFCLRVCCLHYIFVMFCPVVTSVFVFFPLAYWTLSVAVL